MALSETLMAQGSRPSGPLGRLIGSLMNLSHKSVYRWGLEGLSLDSASTALDIGCGGGEAIKLLATRMPGAKVSGIDHSREMVNLATRVNKSLIAVDRVNISHGSVSSLPYADDMFDLATAFETIQFWPHLNEDLREVKRVLKPSGRLLIVNRYPDLEGRDSDWAEVLQIHSKEDYRERLTEAGYIDLTMDDSSKPGWIMVSAKNPWVS